MKTRRMLLSSLGLLGLGLGLWASLDLGSEPAVPAPDRAPVGASSPGPRASTSSRSDLRADRVMVSGPRLEAVAADLGSRLVRDAGPSGWAALAVPEGQSREGFLARLHAVDGLRAAPEARIRAARKEKSESDESSADSSETSEALHLDVALAVAAPADGTDLSGWVVAVIDSGVAYSGAPAELSGLTGIDVVSPWDFVDGDADAWDENQHGSHVASLVLSEHGDYPGVAPGASLMPLRVLDEDNCGTELDLIDAIVHATDAGADVINLSLSFEAGYVPSQALLDALEGAHEADIVLVAAAGNEGSARVTWPAASPRVIAVAALTEGSWTWTAADFSNTGPSVSVGAPGEDVVAETIGSRDPSGTGLWMYSGTSQAAAVVSGAVVWLLEDGVAPADVPASLQASSSSVGWWLGIGDGLVDVQDALGSSNSGRVYHASLLAYLADGRARAAVAVVDEDGDPVAGVWVLGSLRGDADSSPSCYTDAEGLCTLKSGSLTLGDDDVYAFSVEQVLSGGVGYPALPMLYGTDGLEAITSAIEHQGSAQDALLGIYWDGSAVEDLGTPEEAYTLLMTGTGIATSPLSIVFRPGAVSSSLVTSDTLDLDASGIATSPLSLLDVRWVTLDDQQLLALDASGIATSPLSLGPLDLVRYSSGTGIADSPLSFDSDVIFLSSRTSPTQRLSGSAIGDALDGGGFGYLGEGSAEGAAGSGLLGEQAADLAPAVHEASEVEE
jgi:hypothetical protein